MATPVSSAENGFRVMSSTPLLWKGPGVMSSDSPEMNFLARDPCKMTALPIARDQPTERGNLAARRVKRCTGVPHLSTRVPFALCPVPRYPSHSMRTLCIVACLTLSALAFGGVSASLQDRFFQLHPLVAHDNVTPSGRVENGERVVSLYAAEGLWRPEGDHGPSRRVAAFGEEGGPISIPSPLIRVAAGTTVRMAVRNTLEQPLVVHGFCDWPAKTCEPLRIPSGQSRERRFTLKVAGTFHYWAATGAESIDLRTAHESQLGGAVVVDADGRSTPERVFVMTMIEQGPAGDGREVVAFNGRSWPATERLTYSVGDTARWRVINLTAVPHAMHLHGFYYTVESLGDGRNDTVSADGRRPLVVTQQLPPGRTMSMSWVPERAGNWLFHCHMLIHMMSPESLHHGGIPTSHELDASAGMAGLVLGIHVNDEPKQAVVRPSGRRYAMARRHDVSSSPFLPTLVTARRPATKWISTAARRPHLA